MATEREIRLLYGRTGLVLRVPETATVLEGADPPPLPDPADRVRRALENPIGSPSLAELVRRKNPGSVAVTISDITRPVPNQVFLPVLLDVLNASGVPDSCICIIVGTGMHRPSTRTELVELVGESILGRVPVIDHTADRPDSLRHLDVDPPASVCRRFADAEFRIVTGYIEPHFMAGFSGGRKGVCPALVDLSTIQRFHGYTTLADPGADNGVLAGNPCHAAALDVARAVGVDFLLNVAITRDRQIAGVYCGDLEEAHEAGCREVAAWTTAEIEGTYDLVITNGGGYPLDQTFYQTVKGMCTALPALASTGILLQASACSEGVGSAAYRDLMLSYDTDWRRFLRDLAARPGQTLLDQWEFQMQCRVLKRIGIENLRLACDGIPADLLGRLCVTPVEGSGNAAQRLQQWLDRFRERRPAARIAVIPQGPYTLLKRRAEERQA